MTNLTCGLEGSNNEDLINAVNNNMVHISYVSSIADLATVDISKNVSVNVKGYWAVDDGGGGLFNYDAAQSAVNNGGTVINGWVRQIEDYITFRMYGAKGDGITDDTVNVQKALDAGLPVKQNGGNFLFRSTLTIPSNSDIEFNHCKLIKGFTGNGITNENYPLTDDSDISITNLWVEQEDTTNRGNVVSFINTDRLKLKGLKIIQQAVTHATGAWSLYVSGDDIEISEPYIDSRAGGIFADGIHVAYAKNLVISDGIILAGDDAIALYPPNFAWDNYGRDAVGGNITISNMVLGSIDANILRIGVNSVAFDGNDAGNNTAYHGVYISNIVDANIATAIGRKITIQDGRASATVQHKDIVIDGLISSSATSGGFARIYGNADPTNVANNAIRNFSNVEFKNITSDNTDNGHTLFAGGLGRFVIENSKFNRTVVATFTAINFDQIDELIMSDTLIQTGLAGTTGTQADMRFIKKATIDNVRWLGGGEFLLLDLRTNITQDTDVSFNGGSFENTQRGITDNDGIGFNNFTLIGTDFINVTVNEISASVIYTTGTIAKAKSIAHSEGNIGGTGSSGAGNQYVELVVGNITYKVLHDGTI